MICGGTRKRTTHRSYHIVYAYTTFYISSMEDRHITEGKWSVPARSLTVPPTLTDAVAIRTASLRCLDMTICACLTDSYDSTSDINTTVWQVCDTVCVDDQEHKDFHADHPVAAAQGKA